MLSIFSSENFIMAILAGLLISFSGALLSPFLVLKGEALLSDGISHSAFLGFSVGLLLSKQPIYIAILVSVIAGILIKFLIKRTNFKGDAIIGVISGFFLALGLLIISLSSGFNSSIESLMTGDMLLIPKNDLIQLIIAFVIVYVFIIIFYKNLIDVTFNSESSNLSNIKKNIIEYGLLIISCVIIVVGIRLVGALLVSSFIIFPTLISQNFGLSFRKTLFLGVGISLVNVFVSIFLSISIIGIAPGSLIIVMLFVMFMVSLVYKKIRRV